MANNPILETLTIDGVSTDIPQGGQYTAGTNIDITNDVISSLIQSGTNITVGSDGRVNLNTSPALTGTPTAPTVAATNDNQIVATTAFVQSAINRRLPKSGVNYSITTAFSVATGTYVTKDMWTAPSNGTLIYNLEATFASNATGYRQVSFVINSTAASSQQVMAASNAVTTLSVGGVERIGSGSVVRARVRQGSGATINVTSVGLDGYFIPD